MNGKKFAKFSISLTLALLILAGALQITIDPLFQYHQPWFGLKPVVTNERYQNAGIAKTFDYENVIIGNSLAENFYVSDVEKMFGGKTIKLTASGSHTKDWTYLLEILKNKHPKNILINLDPYIMDANPDEIKYELPEYLYDMNYLNDVNYLFNFSILNNYTYNIIKCNRNNRIPDYDKVFSWEGDIQTGRKEAIQHYQRPDKTSNYIDAEGLQQTSLSNLENLTKYYDLMPDTNFVFFCSPFSILYWDKANQGNMLGAWRMTYQSTAENLLKHKNVSVFFWSDEEICNTICNLDYYSDEAHYNSDICKMICNRISQNNGLLNQSNYKSSINRLFDFLDTYNYEAIFA